MENWKGNEGLKKSLAQDPKSKFLDTKGRPRTGSLFHETNTTSSEPMYTLKPYDFDDCLSLKVLYMECRDLTGYLFAEKHLYNYKHFQRLRANKQFAEHFNDWEEELEVLIRAEAVHKMIEFSGAEGNMGLQAAKFIAQKGWDVKGKGRPSKEQVTAEARKQARIKEDILADRKRITKKRIDE